MKKRRKILIPALLIVGTLLLLSFILPSFIKIRGLPPVRTRELGPIPAGIQRASYSFTTPFRRVDKQFWTYRLGIAVPKEEIFDLTGQMVVFSESGEQVSTFPIDVDSMTTSYWLDGPDRVSYMVPGKTGLEDGKTYELELRFDHLTKYEGAVVMHYLNHE